MRFLRLLRLSHGERRGFRAGRSKPALLPLLYRHARRIAALRIRTGDQRAPLHRVPGRQPRSRRRHGRGAARLTAGLARSRKRVRPEVSTQEREMLNHIGLRTKKLHALIDFYETSLKPLGYAKLMADDSGAGFGKDDVPSLW